MSIQRDENSRYTFQDYIKWDEGERYEIMDGELVMLATPTRKHQGIVSFLTTSFNMHFHGNKCKVYPAPFSVRFSEADDYDHADNVFEPDISIVCNKDQLDEYGCKGAPSLIVEVLSPSTAKNDRVKKYNSYQKFGVKEYWIVDPVNETVEVYVLEDGIYQRWNAFGIEDAISSKQFEYLEVSAEDLFTY
ncbi:MAG: Uma2 family endonuclease [Ectobacillus sp.]